MFRPSCSADLEVGVGLQAGDVGRRRIRHDIAFAGLQLLRAHGGVGRDGEDQVVDLLPAAEIAVPGRVADDRVELVVDELERTGADRLLREQLLGAGGLELIGIFLRDDRGEVHAKVRQERRLPACSART